MSTVIKDGTGSGNVAKVNSDNQLEVNAISSSVQHDSAIKGKSYQIGTGPVTLTSAGHSGVLYFKNNEENDIVMTAINVTSSKMTGSTAEVFTAVLYKFPTGLSASTAQTPLNNNFGSSNTLEVDMESGQEAAVVTAGVAAGSFFIPSATFFNAGIAWVFPKGSTIAMGIIPGAGNTSMTLTVTIEGHLV